MDIKRVRVYLELESHDGDVVHIKHDRPYAKELEQELSEFVVSVAVEAASRAMQGTSVQPAQFRRV